MQYLKFIGKKKEAIRRDEIALHEYQGGEK
jgi:hypothetical protein